MDTDKVLEVLALYRKKFEDMGVRINEFDHKGYRPTGEESLAHCHAMVVKTEAFLEDGTGSIGKAKRWLGFIQAILWREGVYTIEELRYHNHP